MDYIKLKARAKINTALDVVRRLENGYHELRMIMQSVNLYDDIFMKKTTSGIIEMKSNLSYLPCDDKNLVYKAVALMKESYNIKEGVFIDLYKRIPVAAGLAGGSSDCAAALIGMNKLFELNVPEAELMSIGKSLGADVPFCLMRGTAIAEGIGEKLTPLEGFPFCYILLCKPSFSVSTAMVFQSLRVNELSYHPDVDKMVKDIKNKDLKAICSGLSNVLETVTIEKYPVIDDIKRTMLSNGALGALMSGSGPTVFGIFDSKQKGLDALEVLKNEHKINDTYLTTVFNTR